MNFPAYVPAVVRKHVSIQSADLQKYLADANREVDRIEREMKGQHDDSEHLRNLRVERVAKARYRDRVAGGVECLLRLAHRPEMKAVYAGLTAEFVNEDQWRAFIDASWGAQADYSQNRDRIKRTDELRNDIADSASQLALWLRQICHIGIVCPDEFYSLTKLLESSDNEERPPDSVSMWRVVRHSIVANSDLHYAWEKSPPLWGLLERLAWVARNFTPAETTHIDAALSSRKANVKNEYIRALGALLAEVHGLTLTPTLRKAMATVATVVLNTPDVTVSDDDVRKTLERLYGSR